MRARLGVAQRREDIVETNVPSRRSFVLDYPLECGVRSTEYSKSHSNGLLRRVILQDFSDSITRQCPKVWFYSIELTNRTISIYCDR